MSEVVLELQYNGDSHPLQDNTDKSSPHSREKITPDKLPDDLGLAEVRFIPPCFAFIQTLFS